MSGSNKASGCLTWTRLSTVVYTQFRGRIKARSDVFRIISHLDVLAVVDIGLFFLPLVSS